MKKIWKTKKYSPYNNILLLVEIESEEIVKTDFFKILFWILKTFEFERKESDSFLILKSFTSEFLKNLQCNLTSS